MTTSAVRSSITTTVSNQTRRRIARPPDTSARPPSASAVSVETAARRPAEPAPRPRGRGGGPGGPAAPPPGGAPPAVVEGEVGARRAHHPAERGDDGDGEPAALAQLPQVELALGLEADDEEEQRHQ